MSYIVGHPIKHPADFYGRHEQVTRFYEIIGGRQAQSVSVLGVRRAGKTSFLQYIAHPSTMAQYLADPDDYTMVYIDLSSCKSPSDFYYRLLQRLKVATPGVPITFVIWSPCTVRDRRRKPTCGCARYPANRPKSIGGTSATWKSAAPAGH